jgi:type II secretory pathway predicted ATPase ExeA
VQPTYTTFYRLRRRPFPLAPDLGAYLATESHRRALGCLSHALGRSEGILVVTGEAGVGKTLLVRYLEARLGARRVLAPVLPAVARGGRVVLEAVAAALGLDARTDGSGPSSRTVEAALRERAPERGSLLLLLDEAQVAAAEALDALRPLVGLAGFTGPLLRLVLIGRPELRERLAAPVLAWLRERIVASHRLAPLEPEEIRPYIEQRLARAGWQDDPRLSAELFPAVRLATGGVPRRINQLMTRVLVLAALDQRHELGAADVEEALDALQEDPSPAPSVPEPRAVAALEAGPWRREVGMLRRRLDALYDELARERRRRDDAEAEVARLRDELRRLGIEPPGLDPLGEDEEAVLQPAWAAAGGRHG